MSRKGKRKQAARTPQTIVIEFRPKDEVRVEDKILEKLSPSERTAYLIEHGCPVAVIETDAFGKEINRTEYNLENIAEPPEHMLKSLARAVYESMQEYYNTPEGKAAFEEWKKQRSETQNQSR